MENETTLPGLLTVPGELLHPDHTRPRRRKRRAALAAAAIGILLALGVVLWCLR